MHIGTSQFPARRHAACSLKLPEAAPRSSSGEGGQAGRRRSQADRFQVACWRLRAAAGCKRRCTPPLCLRNEERGCQLPVVSCQDPTQGRLTPGLWPRAGKRFGDHRWRGTNGTIVTMERWIQWSLWRSRVECRSTLASPYRLRYLRYRARSLPAARACLHPVFVEFGAGTPPELAT